MKKKETIQTLIDFNKWRRWGEWEQPDPKIIGEAIDNAISTLKSRGTWYVEYEWSYKKKYEDTQAILDAGVWELRFSNIQIEILYNAIEETIVMVNDPLAKKILQNYIERFNLDKLVHSRLLFKDKNI